MIYIFITTLHFLFDWVMQPRHIAKAKGFSDEGFQAVSLHILINILPFSIVLGVILYLSDYDTAKIIALLSINLVTHFLIDLLLPKGKNERQMINWTALDQILHLNILFFLLNFL